jgi:hypothetical protein
MNIAQLQITIDREQDRLLLRVNGSDQSEFRTWLTRRLVKQWWPSLVQLLASKVAQDVPTANDDARRMVLGMRHEASVGKADFSQPYRAEATQFPLGQEPIVVSKLTMTLLPQNMYLLTLHPSQGKGVDLRLNDTLLHGLCQMLQNACKDAEWDLPLELPGVAASVETPSEVRVMN